jgi:hypothetical protein
MPARKTKSEIESIFQAAHLKLDEQVYVDSKSALRYTCLICGTTGSTILNRIQQGEGCRKCGIITASSKRKPKLDQVNLAFQKQGLKLQTQTYQNSRQKLIYDCNKCQFEGKISYEKVNAGRGCKRCGIKKRGTSSQLDKTEIIKRLSEKKLSLDPIRQQYNGSNSELLLKCENCGYHFSETINRVRAYNFPCPNCRKGNAELKAKSLRANLGLAREAFAKCNLELLAITYESSLKPLKYKCKKCGYIGKKTYNDASAKKTGCRNCGISIRASKSRLSKIEIDTIAIDSDVKLLEPIIRADKRIKIEFIKCGHSQYKSLIGLKAGSRCSVCSGKQKKTSEDYTTLATQHGGSVIRIGRNSQSLSIWKCSIGHEFQRAYSVISSGEKFCPVCSRKHSEMLAKAIIEKLFNLPFSSHRLRSVRGIGGGFLELDIFNPDLKLAIEHHGLQHSQPIAFFGGEAQFSRQLEHDERRRAACKEAGITLVEVHELGERTSVEEFRKMLELACESNGIPIPESFNTTVLDDIKTNSAAEEYWWKACALAEKRGYEPLSGVYLGATVKHRWRCSQNHEFEMRPRDICDERVKNCPICYRLRRDKPVRTSDGQVFPNETAAAKTLGVSKAAINSGVKNSFLVNGLRLHRISQVEYDDSISLQKQL